MCGSSVRDLGRGTPSYPMRSTSTPLAARARAWYCIRGLRPRSPATTTAARMYRSGTDHYYTMRADLLADVRVRHLRNRQLPLERRHTRLERVGFPNQIRNAFVPGVVRIDAHARGGLARFGQNARG